MKLIFATNNQHKAEELSALVDDSFEIITLKEAGITIDIPEPYNTLEANASAKSGTIFKLTGINCFGEDTGLEAEALQGEPGVNSARYAGEARAFDKNIEKLLLNLEGNVNRNARFRTIISIIIDGNESLFEGICEGKIALAPKGTGGFGYDSIFIPRGAGKTFAEMSMNEKARYSHRAKATEKLIEFLNKIKK